MSHIHASMFGRLAFCSLAPAFVAVFAFGCGGDKSSPNTGTSGAPGAGGTTGTSGAPATSGAPGSSGTTGSSGSGSAGAPSTDGCSKTVPPNANISDFATATSTTWGDATSLTGTFFTYQDAATASTMMISVDPTAQNLHVIAHVGAMGYAGFGMAFGPCTNASGFRGISFTVTGGVPVGSIELQLQTHADNNPAVAGGVRGKCDPTAATCRSPRVGAMITMDPQTVDPTWDLFLGGSPTLTVDTDELWAIQFQFNGKPLAYDVDITIDDVKFLP
jgi:hypothetical protein